MSEEIATIAEVRWWNKFGPWWTKALAASGVVAVLVSGLNDGFSVFDRFFSTAKPDVSVGATGSAAPVTASPQSSEQYGWGPPRQQFSMDSPADFAVLNSIKDRSNYGDERNFVQVRSLKEGSRNTNYLQAEIGEEFLVSVVVYNDAADNLQGWTTTVRGLQMKYRASRDNTDNPIQVTLEGKNVFSVWDSATVLTKSRASLQFVPGSIRLVTSHSPDGGFVVPDLSFAAGGPVPLGQTALDGKLPVGYDSSNKYQGYGFATFKLRVVDPT